MRFFDLLNGVVSFFNRIVVLSLAGFVILFLLTTVFQNRDILEYILEYREIALWSAGVSVALNLFPLLQDSFRSRGKSGYVMAPGGTSGPSRVKIQALKRSLTTTATDIPGVCRAKLNVQRLSPRYFRVNVRYWTVEGDNAVAVGERLQLVLKRRLSELVELDKRHRVVIDAALAGVISRDKAGIAKNSGHRGFQGPVYPVDAALEDGA